MSNILGPLEFVGGVAVGTGVGSAVGRAVEPLVQDLANETWQAHPSRPPDAIILAQAVAQRQVDPGQAHTWAAQQGIGGTAFDALVAAYDTGPGVAYAFELWRRNLIGDGAFQTALKREGIEDQWTGPLAALKRRLLSPAELANAVVQGHRTFAAALADAELQGYTQGDFQTMVDNTGLPPGPETGLEWLRRGILSPGEFDQLILEGHTKPKYIPFYHQAQARVLSAADYAGLRLRGWITPAESYSGGALTGYTQQQMDQLFLNRGRPATPRQIRVGYARGARITGFAGDVTAAIHRVTEQSDIRPEYADVEVAASYTLPSPFVLRGLAQSGALTQAQVHTILLQSGWLEEYAAAVAAFWTKAGTAKTANETKSELADEYEAGWISEAEFRQHLTTLGLVGHEQDLEVQHADFSAIHSARTAAVTKLRTEYEKGTLTEAVFSGSLAALGMHNEPIQREVAYANIVRNALGVTG